MPSCACSDALCGRVLHAVSTTVHAAHTGLDSGDARGVRLPCMVDGV